MQIAAVIVTFRRLGQLQLTLKACLAEPLDLVVVVDNASDDETGGWLAAQDDPRLHVVTLPENRGGAGGFEAGLAAVAALGPVDWTVLMDDDARPEPGAIAAFRNETSALPPATGCVAAAVFYPDGTLCEMNRPSSNPFWNLRLFVKTLFRGNRAGFHLPDAAFAPAAPPVAIDVASFVGFFVHRDAVAATGLPEGGLFIYGDDVLYSLRLRRAGVGMMLLPAVRFTHDCGTMGQGFIYRPLWKIYYHCRNGVAIARAAAGPLIFPAALAYYTAVWWRRQRFYDDPAERRLYRRLMFRGLRDGLMWRRGRNDAVHALKP